LETQVSLARFAFQSCSNIGWEARHVLHLPGQHQRAALDVVPSFHPHSGHTPPVGVSCSIIHPLPVAQPSQRLTRPLSFSDAPPVLCAASLPPQMLARPPALLAAHGIAVPLRLPAFRFPSIPQLLNPGFDLIHCQPHTGRDWDKVSPLVVVRTVNPPLKCIVAPTLGPSHIIL
jgi:hypothetical protein